MVKKAAFFLACLLGFSFFTACETVTCHELEGEEMTPSQMLTDGIWDLKWIETTDLEDEQATSWTEEYGLGTDNGICTFDFDEDNTCVMIDVESEEENEYVMYRDGNLTIGGDPYFVEELTDKVLELVTLEGENCDEFGEERMHFER